MKKTAFVAAVPLMALLISCTNVPDLPPISDSGKYQPGKIIWHDLVTPNPKAARTFYSTLLGWEFTELDDSGYSLIRLDGNLIGGMVDANKIGKPVKSALWVNAVSVADIDAAVKAVTKSGGRVIHKPQKLSKRGRVAVVMDQEGAIVQLIQSFGGDPLEVDPGMNDWLWTELLAKDPEGAEAFYRSVIGYNVSDAPVKTAAEYRMLKTDGKPRAGIIENPFEDTRSAWVPYVRVSDTEAMAAKAAKLGGKVVIEPKKELRNGTIAVVLDPSGAPIALQKWSGEKAEGK